jgi:hypothetical protein
MNLLPECSPAGVIDQIAINALTNQVALAADGGGNDRQAGGVSFLNCLAKSLFCASVNKHIHRGISVCQVIAREATGEDHRVTSEAVL